MDPLRDLTRRQRKSLLLSSLLAFIMSWGGMLPQRVDAWGMSFDRLNPFFLLFIVAGMTFYFLASFVIYARFDLQDHIYHRLRLRYKDEIMRIDALDINGMYHSLWSRYFARTTIAEIDNLYERLRHFNASALISLAHDLQATSPNNELDNIPVRETAIFAVFCDADNHGIVERSFCMCALLWQRRSFRLCFDFLVPVLIGVAAIFSAVGFGILFDYESVVGAWGAS